MKKLTKRDIIAMKKLTKRDIIAIALSIFTLACLILIIICELLYLGMLGTGIAIVWLITGSYVYIKYVNTK